MHPCLILCWYVRLPVCGIHCTAVCFCPYRLFVFPAACSSYGPRMRGADTIYVRLSNDGFGFGTPFKMAIVRPISSGSGSFVFVLWGRERGD